MANFLDELNKAAEKLQASAQSLLDKTDIDEKIVAAATDAWAKAQSLLDQTDIDEKALAAAGNLKDKAQAILEKACPAALDGAKDLMDKGAKKLQQMREGDAMDQIGRDVAEQVEKIRAAATSAIDPIHAFMQSQLHDEAKAAEAAVEEAVEGAAAEAAVEEAVEGAAAEAAVEEAVGDAAVEEAAKATIEEAAVEDLIEDTVDNTAAE